MGNDPQYARAKRVARAANASMAGVRIVLLPKHPSASRRSVSMHITMTFIPVDLLAFEDSEPLPADCARPGWGSAVTPPAASADAPMLLSKSLRVGP